MFNVSNLTVSVEDNEILNNFSLDVGPGEVHAIMGPNGSGKSTLAHVCAGKEDYTVLNGEINLNGEDLLDLEADERSTKGLFLAFQYPIEIPGVTTLKFDNNTERLIEQMDLMDYKTMSDQLESQ